MPYLFAIATLRSIRQMVKEGLMTEKSAASCVESVTTAMIFAYICLSAIVDHRFVN
jgi:hypothetical protein